MLCLSQGGIPGGTTCPLPLISNVNSDYGVKVLSVQLQSFLLQLTRKLWGDTSNSVNTLLLIKLPPLELALIDDSCPKQFLL